MDAKRGNGMVYRRGRIWWLKFYQDGDVVRMTSGTTDEAKARRLLKEQIARITLNEPLVVRSARTTWAELRDNLLAHYRATGSRDVIEASYRIKHLDRHFGGWKAAAITSRAIADYITKRQSEVRVTPVPGLRRTPTTATVNREAAILLKALRLGVEHGRLARVPIVHRPEESPARAGFLEPAEFEAIRAYLPLDCQVIATLLYDNAWRLREVTHLLRRQVDLDRGCIRLDPGQAKSTGDPRTVYLREGTLAMLRDHVERVRALERETGTVIPYLFPIFPGPSIPTRLIGRQRDSFDRAWDTACAAAGYPGRLVHDLRRSGIRNLVRAGVAERIVMSISGHRSRSTFDRYNITSESDLQSAAAQLDAARKAAASSSGTMSGTIAPVRPLRPKRSAAQSDG